LQHLTQYIVQIAADDGQHDQQFDHGKAVAGVSSETRSAGWKHGIPWFWSSDPREGLLAFLDLFQRLISRSSRAFCKLATRG
jgi:hypothetical protein